jgi:hypothetical protein
MASLRLLRPGKLVVSLDKILFPNQMAPCAAQPDSPYARTSGAEKLMEACAWSMPPAFGVVAPASYASSANGMAVRRQSRAR